MLLRVGIFVSLLAAGAAAGADYDLLIRNARILEGAGNPWYHADVGIRSGRIAALGRLAGATAERTIDARGRILAPGFIDVHTHIEQAVEKLPGADNFVLDGVTTVVTGNCGSSEVDLAGFFARLERLGIGLNVAALIGHSSVRRRVMGTQDRPPAPAEMARMQELVAQGMRDGALGFSTGLIYIPGAYATTAEVVALAKAAAQYGGVYATHLRDEGAQILEAITEAVTVGRQAGLPVRISHFKIDNQRFWGASEQSIALVEKFRGEGVDVVVDQHPYDRSSTSLSVVAPSWALAGGREGLRERLHDPVTATHLRFEMAQRLKHLGQADYSYATVARFPPNPSCEGKTISEINVLKGREATLEAEIQTVLDLLLAGGAQMLYHSMSEEDVERILRYPNTAVASDSSVREFGAGWPHPRSYGTHARVLAEFVRKRQVITLEDAIRRMTWLAAQAFRLGDRGLVREGMAADLVLFDPDRVADRATYQQPHQYSEGFDWVLVNGVPVVEEGQLTGARPGQVLRSR